LDNHGTLRRLRGGRIHPLCMQILRPRPLRLPPTPRKPRVPQHPTSTSPKTYPGGTTPLRSEPETHQGTETIIPIEPRTLRPDRSSPCSWPQLLDEIRVRRTRTTRDLGDFLAHSIG